MQCPNPLHIQDPNSEKTADRLTVPCGKCGACLHNRRTDWSFRLKQELRYSKTAHFITFTYDEDNLPLSQSGIPTLVKSDWQLFVKKLRKRLQEFTQDKFRYYTVGEYGTKTGRPHYHSIAFNLPHDILPFLHDIWNKGIVDIGTVEDASIHYVTKYHVNKRNKTHEYVHEETGEIYYRSPEFATMSRRPGIGNKYIETTKQWHIDGKRDYVVNNGYKQRIPRYFREKIFDPITRLVMSKRKEPELDKEYNKEVERLSKLKVERPESYMLRSKIKQAKKVKHKINENDTM